MVKYPYSTNKTKIRNMRPKILALYLPQFHPFPENDEWWGKGFTEWTNVGKAERLFKGHYQPRVPSELGYYDLRLPVVREQQAELAKEAGVTAFCYWHYWFGNGKQLMENIFNEVLESGKPDFPFCLAWANHTWRAVGCTAGNYDPRILIEQTYPGVEDAKMHFNYLLKAFRDERYVKIDGKPYLFIYDSVTLPQLYIDNFKKWTIEAGFPDLFIVANVNNRDIPKETLLDKGFDAVCYCNLSPHESFSEKVFKNIKSRILQRPKNLYDYKILDKILITDAENSSNVIPQIVPQWDHSPRLGNKSFILKNASPEKFAKHVRHALEAIKNKPEEQQIIMLKSWNEWAEGNYMEPDLKFGRGYINALREVLDEYKNK